MPFDGAGSAGDQVVTRFHVAVPNFMVTKQLLGRALPLGQLDGVPYQLIIPDGDEYFDWSPHDVWHIFAWGRPRGSSRGSAVQGPHRTWADGAADGSVRRVDVVGLERVDEQAQPLKQERLAGPAVPYEWFDRSNSEVHELARRLIIVLRQASNQHSIGLSYEVAQLLNPVTFLLQGKVISATTLVNGSVVLDAEGMTLNQAEALTKMFHQDLDVLAAKTLVQDAQWLTTWGSSDDQRSLGVVFAALSVESAIKRALRQHVSPQAALLLRKLEGKLSIREMFNEPAEAVLGHNLRQENEELAARLQRLFEARNRYVHHLGRVSRDEGVAHAQTAWDLLAWLNMAQADLEAGSERNDPPT